MTAPDQRLPADEIRRIQALYGLDILDTPPEERFDRLTRLARRVFDVPIALVSLVDVDRQWFKSRAGVDMTETPREWSFCSHTITDDGVLVISDAQQDDRFRDSPLVTEDPEVRFYAGCTVKAPDGSALGTICIIDHRPRDLPRSDAELLEDLAGMVESEIKAIQIATVDELTGVTNLRGFNAIASYTLAVCQRAERPATLLMFDLNYFKEINDEHGHAEGDRVLKEFAQALSTSFRDSDVVARLGGDEFGVLLSGTTPDLVAIPLANLDRRLEANDPEGRISYSVGTVAYDPERHKRLADLLHAADVRMYEHKRSIHADTDGSAPRHSEGRR